LRARAEADGEDAARLRRLRAMFETVRVRDGACMRRCVFETVRVRDGACSRRCAGCPPGALNAGAQPGAGCGSGGGLALSVHNPSSRPPSTPHPPPPTPLQVPLFKGAAPDFLDACAGRLAPRACAAGDKVRGWLPPARPPARPPTRPPARSRTIRMRSNCLFITGNCECGADLRARWGRHFHVLPVQWPRAGAAARAGRGGRQGACACGVRPARSGVQWGGARSALCAYHTAPSQEASLTNSDHNRPSELQTTTARWYPATAGAQRLLGIGQLVWRTLHGLRGPLSGGHRRGGCVQRKPPCNTMFF
jgi:hypothetical protein